MPKYSKQKEIITGLLAMADVVPGRGKPWDIAVHNEAFYGRVLSQGTLGLGESYMDGWWDCEKLDEFIYKTVSANLKDRVILNWTMAKTYLQAKLFNRQNVQRSREVIEKHYDLSNELYMSFLDPYNQYTCGYFKNTTDLNIAQEQKLKLICEKLQLKPTDQVLDIGCGWGGFAKYAAEHYGCHVTGVTISKEQAKYARDFTKGLPVTIQEIDYRDLTGSFDKILICGMIEHVGPKNYKKIFSVVHRCLKNDGLFLLQTIGDKNSRPLADPWIDKYIFPNGILPALNQLIAAGEKLFITEDLQNFGAYYDPTLMAWFKNFDAHWDTIKNNFDERFYRMWKYYLLSCAGVFRARHMQLWHFVFSKKGLIGGYNSIRP